MRSRNNLLSAAIADNINLQSPFCIAFLATLSGRSCSFSMTFILLPRQVARGNDYITNTGSVKGASTPVVATRPTILCSFAFCIFQTLQILQRDRVGNIFNLTMMALDLINNPTKLNPKKLLAQINFINAIIFQVIMQRFFQCGGIVAGNHSMDVKIKKYRRPT